MQVTAYHDDHGNLVALIARSEGAPRAQIELRPGWPTTEVDVPELTADLDDAQVAVLLSDLRSNRRVDLSGDTPRLTHKA